METDKIISKIDSFVSNHHKHMNGSVYQAICKLIAELCINNGDRTNGLYYLTEAHGAALRTECSYQFHLNKIRKEFKQTVSISAINENFVSFSSLYSNSKYNGLIQRLKEMPKEWTIIQITQSFNPHERWKTRMPNSVSEVSKLHIVRFSCGIADTPCYVKVHDHKSLNNGTVSIFKLLSDATMDRRIHMKLLPTAQIKHNRIENSHQIKAIVREIISYWIKEWSCLLVGKLCDAELEAIARNSVDNILDNCNQNVSEFDKAIIRQIANGCAHLNEEEIELAIFQIINNVSLQKKLTEAIINFKNSYANLITAKRHPVILVLDEKLECIPWETISTLRRHPVSRLPSIHFAHAMYKKYENSIVNGNKIISNSELGYYIVNPDLSLKSTEDKIINFLKDRAPTWCGLASQKPSKNDFINALKNFDIFLYCGHGNGTQYINSCEINEICVKTVPLLFGCSSLQHKHIGGRTSYISLSHHYLIAGSPCMLGMLWSVTNRDTDSVALTLLNNWLPGEPALIEGCEEIFDEARRDSKRCITKELELLRITQISRDSALLFSNGSAMVIYGIPIKIKL